MHGYENQVLFLPVNILTVWRAGLSLGLHDTYTIVCLDMNYCTKVYKIHITKGNNFSIIYSIIKSVLTLDIVTCNWHLTRTKQLENNKPIISLKLTNNF